MDSEKNHCVIQARTAVNVTKTQKSTEVYGPKVLDTRKMGGNARTLPTRKRKNAPQADLRAGADSVF